MTTYVNGNKVDTWLNSGQQVSVAKLDGKVVYDKASNTEILIKITADNYNVTASWVINQIMAACGGAPVSGSYLHFYINPGVTLVANSTTDAFVLDGSWWSGMFKNCGVVFENWGTVLGRGGQGGDSGPGWGAPGRSGGDALVVSGMNVVVINNGILGGGGGGGAGSGWFYGGSGNYNCTGGGGAPFGQPGTNTGSNYRYYGSAATINAPGTGGSGNGGSHGTISAGNGGGWGGAGGNGSFKPAGSGPTYNYYSGGGSGNSIRLMNGGLVNFSIKGTLYGNVS